MIHQFIKQRKTEISPAKKVKMTRTHKVGVLVATKRSPEANDPTVYVGWSLVNRDAGDKFNHEDALRLACDRAVSIDMIAAQCEDHHTIPCSIRKHMRKFLLRCDRYFNNSAVTKSLKGHVGATPLDCNY